MTAQITDLVRYTELDWSLAGVNGEGLFDPAAHGLKVRAASTACYRGFACAYALREGALFLDDLHVATEGEAPRLLGCAPEQAGDLGFTARYRKMGHFVPFTGGLLLGDGFVRELYVHMGFHPAWKYRRVLEVELDEGHVTKLSDCSAAMAEIRTKLGGRDVPARGAPSAEVRAWIDRAFSRSY